MQTYKWHAYLAEDENSDISMVLLCLKIWLRTVTDSEITIFVPHLKGTMEIVKHASSEQPTIEGL